MTTTKEKHSQLKKLASKARTNLYEMLKLAVEILDDPAYSDEFGGQQSLQDHLEATDFIHFGGKPSLASMLRAFRKNPDRATWQEYRFNIQAMIELAKPVRETDTRERINWKSLAKELEVKQQILEAELTELREKYDQALTKLGRLSRQHELV